MQSRKAALHGAAHPLSPKPSAAVPQFSIYQAKAAQKEYRQKYVAAYPQKRVKRLETLFVYKSFNRDNNKQVTGKGEKKTCQIIIIIKSLKMKIKFNFTNEKKEK